VRVLESCTPKHRAEKILMSQAALESARKHVTVLCVDLKRSMVAGDDPRRWAYAMSSSTRFATGL
jgi:hypothetical protein